MAVKRRDPSRQLEFLLVEVVRLQLRVYNGRFRETGLHPAILKDQVITPGGVTISAIHELERHGLRAMLISAIETATNHSRKLSEALLDRFSKES